MDGDNSNQFAVNSTPSIMFATKTFTNEQNYDDKCHVCFHIAVCIVSHLYKLLINCMKMYDLSYDIALHHLKLNIRVAAINNTAHHFIRF